MNYFLKKVSLIFGILLFWPLTLNANVVRDAHTEVEFISESPFIDPSRPVSVALRMKMDDGWHTYWKNSGDAGLPTKIQWELPEGFKASDIQWPYPKRLEEEGLTTYGYSDEIFLLTDIETSKNISQKEVVLKAHVKWLACEKICIPGKADLELTLPVIEGGLKGFTANHNLKLFAKIRNLLPQENKNFIFNVYEATDNLHLYITALESEFALIRDVEFFPERNDVIDHAAFLKVMKKKTGFELIIPKASISEGKIDSLKGVAVFKYPGDRILPVSVDIAQTLDQPLVVPVVENSAHSAGGGLTVWMACIFAFIGGVILNLMPCVLPVLSIKVLSLIEHAQRKDKAWKNGLIFALGILVSFWVLAFILIFLKTAGTQAGWGFQFQSPVFVILISSLLFVMSLNLMGLFELETSITGLKPISPQSSGYASAFTSGILAVILATPCSAPFMGSALGFALTQSPAVILCVFTFLGLGLAFPYLILVRFPKLLKWIPKPGPWMVLLKQFFGFVLMAAVVWLVWVLGMQRGVYATTMLCLGFLFIGLAIWVMRFTDYYPRLNKNRGLIRFLAFILVLGGLSLPLGSASKYESILWDEFSSPGKSSIVWLNFSEKLVEELRAQNRIVFVNFTAAWCLSCKVNERLVFSNKEIMTKFKDMKISALKADWTNFDESITRALKNFNKSSIPVYVIYPQSQKSPVILPEIITPKIVLEALDKLNNN